MLQLDSYTSLQFQFLQGIRNAVTSNIAADISGHRRFTFIQQILCQELVEYCRRDTRYPAAMVARACGRLVGMPHT